MLRVLFLTLYPDQAASPRYRVAQFLPYLRAHGVECTVASPLTADEFAVLTGPGRSCRPLWYHLKEALRRTAQILSARRYDVVFVQKAVMTAYVKHLDGLLRSRARRLVYDIDDAVHLAPPHPLRFPWTLAEDRNQITRMMASADLVLAGNCWLASTAREAGARVELFPTVVDTDRFVPSVREPDGYRIGWIGNPSTTICLEPAARALETVKDASVCLVGADAARVPFAGAEVRPWSLEGEVAELQRFSAGIMPQPGGDWMRGKCALKALQYMACGVPCVATPFGAVTDFLQDRVNGLYADSCEEWLAAFEHLREAGVRRAIGGAGRETVERDYSLKHAAPRMLGFLEGVA